MGGGGARVEHGAAHMVHNTSHEQEHIALYNAPEGRVDAVRHRDTNIPRPPRAALCWVSGVPDVGHDCRGLITHHHQLARTIGKDNFPFSTKYYQKRKITSFYSCQSHLVGPIVNDSM